MDYHRDAGAVWPGDAEIALRIDIKANMQGVRVAELIASNRLTVVVGLGATGLSVARFLSARNEPFVVVDSRQQPPALAQLKALLPEVRTELGRLDSDTLCAADELIVSPGLPLDTPALVEAANAGVRISGDIALFARHARAPIVAITGSNGKSTVTTLLGEMAQLSGKNVGVGGNLGTPALDLLDDERDLYVLELSSFQLESLDSLGAEVATVLNVSPDHMDRYATIHDYHRAKHRIFKGARQVVVNRDDILSQPLIGNKVNTWTFGLSKPDFGGFGLLDHQGEPWLAFEFEPWLALRELRIKGSHNIANALCALALGHAIGLPQKVMLDALRVFPGLAHRCQHVAQRDGVTWIDDSKATNIGAMLAAVEGLSGDVGVKNTKTNPHIILIAGGQGKGQDFSVLPPALIGRVKYLVLMGEDAGQIGQVVDGSVPYQYANSMAAAVAAAAELALAGDTVLLSPACASFDMFSGFEARGRCFADAVRALA